MFKYIKNHKHKKGFTFIELIVVIAVIAVLVLLALPRFIGQVDKAEMAQIKNDVKVVESIVADYLVGHNDLSEIGDEVSDLPENDLYNTRGEVSIANPIKAGPYRLLSEEILNKAKTNLDGDFYSNEEGVAYYHDTSGSGDGGNEVDDDFATVPDVPEGYDVTKDWNEVPDGSDGAYPEWTDQSLFEWEIEPDGSATITYYIGMKVTPQITDVVIPEHIEVDGTQHRVKKIGKSAFLKQAIGGSLNTVHIPNTVEEIGPSAFYSVNGGGGHINSIYIGKNVNTIASSAFGGTNFETLVTPIALNTLGEGLYNWSNDSGLKSVNMYYSTQLELIPTGTFSRTPLEEVIFPKNLKELGSGAFSQTKLEEITIPNTVTKMSSDTFMGSENLEYVYFEDLSNVPSVEGYDANPNNRAYSLTFYNDLLKPTFKQPYNIDQNTNTLIGYWHDGQPRDIVIPSEVKGVTVKHIDSHVFSKKSSTDYTVAGLLTSWDAQVMDSVTIPSTVETIGAQAFMNHEGEFPKGVFFEGETIRRIDSQAFFGIATKHIDLPNSIESLGSAVFNASKLETVTLSTKLTTISDGLFASSNLTSIDLHEGITSIGRSSFAGTQLSEITIPNSVESIGENAFANTNITEVTIPSHVDVHPDAFDAGVIIHRN